MMTSASRPLSTGHARYPGQSSGAVMPVMAKVLQGVQKIITAMKDGSVEVRIGSPQGVLSKTESTLTIVG